MASVDLGEKPHAVCIPFPAQGHITPMLKLANLLFSFHGFRITFVNTHFNHRRLLRSGAISSSIPDFRYESIPDGLPPSDDNATQDIAAIFESIAEAALPPFLNLLRRLLRESPPVSCIVSDGSMSFTLHAAKELGLPEAVLWTTSACGFMAYLHHPQLRKRGLFPLTGEDDLTNGYLDTPVDWVPGMKNMRLRDFPSFIRTTNPDDILFKFPSREAQRTALAAGVVLNTFHEFERPVLEAMAQILPRVYTVGPLSLITQHHQVPGEPLPTIGSNLWKEDSRCIDWLQNRKQGSVVYANFGSITVMSNAQLVEFAWGLAYSGYDFLWVVRPDLVRGDKAVLPAEFLEATAERGLIATWCSQEAVLAHEAVGGFLTHSGWNSTLESVCAGVPMLSWPFFAEQQTNCRYACTEWGIGMEIDGDVRRDEVGALIRELMGGDKGRDMRRRAAEWRESARRAAEPGGSSSLNLDKLVKEVLLGGAT